jgi:hypothetical protein
MKKLLVTVAALAAVGLLAGTASASQNIRNGGFEAGKFKDWKTLNGGPGFWYLYNETSPPPWPTLAPIEGNWAAGTIQFEASWQIMYQQLHLKAGNTSLFFGLYYGLLGGCCGAPQQNGFDPKVAPKCAPTTLSPSVPCGGDFCPQTSLDVSGGCNEQLRIDVLRDGSAPTTFRSKDILRTLFLTDDSAPPFILWTPMWFDLSDFSGRTVTLRFLVTASFDPLVVGVDAVGIGSVI